MKRITKIEIENYRAFFDNYKIELPNGENLLVYGENGSGKSSLFKALDNYLASSAISGFPFVKNVYSTAPNGDIKISFQDFNDSTFQPVFGTIQQLNFGSVASSNNVQFVREAELIKGFLGYRNLLDVYFNADPNPNLFKLLCLKILGKQLNIAKTFRFADKWKSIQTDLIDNSRNRKTLIHRNALLELPIYHSALKEVLKDVFKLLNINLLSKYFSDLNIQLQFDLKPMTFNYNIWKELWNTTSDLRLNVIQNGNVIPNYGDFLNEARLSAFAVCIYLASILRNPELIDFKILFIDDVFVGLDTSNRIPILEILQKEFTQHQIFIATYDRHLYELAKRKFEIETPGKWNLVEFYVGKEPVIGQIYEKPIIVIGESNFEQATKYLHDRVKPDYPASANYFRKTLEETIQQFIPKWETADIENSSQLPEYKLGPLIFRAKRFMDKTKNSSSTLNAIISLLPSLLHPLSHHDISSPIYKGELLRIEMLIPKLIDELKRMDIPSNYKCSALEGRNRIRIIFIINSVMRFFSFYELKTTDPMCLKYNPGGLPIISNVHLYVEKCWGEKNGTTIPGSKKEFSQIEREQPDFNFNSLQDAYDKLHAKVTSFTHIGFFAKQVDFLDALEFQDQDGSFKPIKSILFW